MKPIFVASTYRRGLAYSVDSLINQIFWLPVSIQAVGSWFRSQEISIDVRWVILSFLMCFGYSIFFNYFLGGTIGKLVFGLRIVNKNDPEGGLSFMQSLLRVLTEQLGLFFGMAGQSLMFLRFDRTHLADWVAETRVVQSFERDSPPKRRPVLVLFLFFYFFVTGFSTAYQVLRSTDLENGKLVYFENTTQDSPSN